MFRKFTINLISAYQVALSPFLKAILGQEAFCRFEETCSAYTKRQINEKGVIKGLYLGLIRIMKCQPFYNGNLRRETI